MVRSDIYLLRVDRRVHLRRNRQREIQMSKQALYDAFQAGWLARQGIASRPLGMGCDSCFCEWYEKAIETVDRVGGLNDPIHLTPTLHIEDPMGLHGGPTVVNLLIDQRPVNCRNRLKDEHKPHPRSGCAYCKTGGIRGCPFESRRPAKYHGGLAKKGKQP
jgi:hypothetical protein